MALVLSRGAGRARRSWPAWADAERAGLVLALSLHAVVLGGLAWHLRGQQAPQVQLMSVRLLSPTPVAPSLAPRPSPPAKSKLVSPPPITRAATSRPLPAAEPVPPAPASTAPQPPEPVPAKTPAPAEAPPVEATLPPRFDVSYLDNPPPRYPPISRRLGEQGRVLLRVDVSASGDPLAVLVHQGSGFSRLDQSAVDAVRAWRFVPARRGQQAVTEWVVVPVVFSLTR